MTNLMKYIVSINDKNYEVEVERGEARIIKTTQAIHVETASPAPVQATPAAQAVASAPAMNQQAVDGEPLKAPMPGTILSVKVNAGASVKKGDVLFILEAMKMENEIAAPRDCVVAQIIAQKGATVSTGDVLAALM